MDGFRIAHLYRYPIKSVLGESCGALTLNERGVEFDRLYAITDAEGKFGSHKTTRRFRKIDGLFELGAVVKDGVTWVRFPDGAEFCWNDDEVSSRLSAHVGQPVTLQAEKAISHFDDGPLHIITSASMAWLQAKLPDSVIDPRRFRANMVISCEGDEPVEQSWIGRTLNLGTCQVEIVSPCERCLMTTLAQENLPLDSKILTTIGRSSDLSFGVYAKVIKPGVLKSGDSVVFG